MWKVYGWLVGLVGMTGCAALESGVRSSTDFVFGTPGGEQVVNTVTGVAAGLPPPWNFVATGIVGAIVGVGGWVYRRRLLKTDPAKID